MYDIMYNRYTTVHAGSAYNDYIFMYALLTTIILYSVYVIKILELSGRWQAPRSTRKKNSEGIVLWAMPSARRAESS